MPKPSQPQEASCLTTPNRGSLLGCRTCYIEPGSPWENGYCDSFNGRLRDECLNGEIFYSLREAQIVIENWRIKYNTFRPHFALGYRRQRLKQSGHAKPRLRQKHMPYKHSHSDWHKKSVRSPTGASKSHQGSTARVRPAEFNIGIALCRPPRLCEFTGLGTLLQSPKEGRRRRTGIPVRRQIRSERVPE